MSPIVQILLAASVSILSIILLIKFMVNIDRDKLDLWLGFLKFFLGTFVIGLLGFFAKLSYDNRQMAVTESEQIGKYVQNAMSEDLSERMRFAQYFSLVLPENHTTGWREYYDTLQAQELATLEAIQAKNVDIVEMDAIQASTEKLVKKNDHLSVSDSLKIIANTKKLDSLYNVIESRQKIIDDANKLFKATDRKGNASIASPDDFTTCRAVENLMPYGRGSSFNKGSKVYIHAFIKSPIEEEITILWKDYLGKEWNKTTSKVGVNLGRGYRLFDHVRPKSPGGYSVEMINQAGDVIGFKKFVVK